MIHLDHKYSSFQIIPQLLSELQKIDLHTMKRFSITLNILYITKKYDTKTNYYYKSGVSKVAIAVLALYLDLVYL